MTGDDQLEPFAIPLGHPVRPDVEVQELRPAPIQAGELELGGLRTGRQHRAAQALAFAVIEGHDVTIAAADPTSRQRMLELTATEIRRLAAERQIDPHDALQRLGSAA